jgi:hypothetical protein
MPQPTLTQRVASLEARMDDVEPRVTIIETELRTFRVEVRQEFAAFRVEVRQEFAAVRTEMAALGETLRKEMRDGNEESRRFMRVLHEDLVERIQAIGDGSRPPNGRRRSRKT